MSSPSQLPLNAERSFKAGNSEILQPDNKLNYPLQINKLKYKTQDTGKYNTDPKTGKPFLLVGPGVYSTSPVVCNSNTIRPNKLYRVLNVRYNSRVNSLKQF